MKILFLSNNANSFRLMKWLTTQNVELFFSNAKLNEEYIKCINPDLIVSFNYKYILRKKMLDLYPNKFINLHISYLPFNKGSDPNVWSFLDNTPKGVTIHLIDEGIDSGDILFQEEINFDTTKETLASSYHTLIDTITELFIRNWEVISEFKFITAKQDMEGTLHYKKDFEEVKNLMEPEGYNINLKEFINRYKNLNDGK